MVVSRSKPRSRIVLLLLGLSAPVAGSCSNLLGFDDYHFANDGNSCGRDPCEDGAAGAFSEGALGGTLAIGESGLGGSRSAVLGGAASGAAASGGPQSGGAKATPQSRSGGEDGLGGAGGAVAAGGSQDPMGGAGTLASMALIQGGVYLQPGTTGARTVAVPSYYLDLHEVTVEEYFSCVAAEECSSTGSQTDCHNSLTLENADHPVNCVGWIDADRYCRSIHKRLPTEEEWEFAVHRGTGRPYPWGTASGDATYANFAADEVSGGATAWGSDTYRTTAPIGSFPRGATREDEIHDLFGNVYEYTSNLYCPIGTASCSTCPSDKVCADRCDDCSTAMRVHKGLGWGDAPSGLAVALAVRGYGPIDGYAPYLGFRCAKTSK